MTPQQLFAICPRAPIIWTAALNPAMEWANIDTEQRTASFIAQCAHESSEFTRLVENLNYSTDGLIKTFPRHFTLAEASTYARKPESIANRVYSSRMGNGDEASGDGWKYRGRGPFQLTGRDNYKYCSEALYNDDRLVENPDAVIDPKTGAMTAAWFWLSKGLNVAADSGDQKRVTKLINGGWNGLDERMAYYERAISVLTAP